MYSAEGDEQLSVSVGRDVSIYYEDTDEMPLENNLIPFDVSLDDGGWVFTHALGVKDHETLKNLMDIATTISARQ